MRASVVVLTELLKEVCLMQKTSPSSSVGLGRLLVGTTLIASQMKDDQAIAFQINGQGDFKKIFAHAQFDGLCRGFISEKNGAMSIERGQISVAPLIAGGILTGTTYIPGQVHPRQSQLQIVSGEIGEDLAHYLNQSQQLPCLISLAVKIGSQGEVLAAGGVLVELMPGHTEKTLSQIEEAHGRAKSLSDLIVQNASCEELLANHVGLLKNERGAKDSRTLSLHLLSRQGVCINSYVGPRGSQRNY